MLHVSQALELSFYLGLLNYVVGALLLGSPLPFPSIKRIGAALMKDAMVIWILASSFTLILNLLVYLRDILGLDWSNLTLWLTGLAVNISSLMALLRTLSSMMGPLSPYIAPIISNMVSLLSTSLLSVLALQILGLVVSTKTPDIIAIGILLYSIPMGFFKRAGSILISFALVFSLALPAMPMFTLAFLPSLAETSSWNTSYPIIEVRDLTGGALGNSLLLIYQSPEKTQGSEIAIVPVDENGIAQINSTPGLPINRVYYFSLEMFGWRLYSSSNMSLGMGCAITSCSYRVTVDGVLVSDSPYILIQTPLSLTSYVVVKDIENRYIKITMDLADKSFLVVTLPTYTFLEEALIDGRTISWNDRRSWSWAGVQGYDYYLSLDPGVHVVELRYVKGAPLRPLLQQYTYYGAQQEDIQNMFSNIILLLFVSTVFPSVYLTLLVMATYSLARFIERGSR